MACKTCNRALHEKDHDKDGNCPDCAKGAKKGTKAKRKQEAPKDFGLITWGNFTVQRYDHFVSCTVHGCNCGTRLVE